MNEVNGWRQPDQTGHQGNVLSRSGYSWEWLLKKAVCWLNLKVDQCLGTSGKEGILTKVWLINILFDQC